MEDVQSGLHYVQYRRRYKQQTVNRMETVMKQINTKYKATHEREPKPDVIFKMSISAVDVRPFSKTEEWIRESMGFPIEKELAKSMVYHAPQNGC